MSLPIWCQNNHHMANQPQAEIAHNIHAHDAVVRRYERRHGEIFNPVEQRRLAEALTRAKNAIQTGVEPGVALDAGCGSGNLTAHLLPLGFTVIAADVSPKFLDLVQERFQQTGRLSTVRLNGRDLMNLQDDSVDFAGVYSVLHHVPDYLGLVREMMRVIKPGGVIYLDHERAAQFWQPTESYREFVKLAKRPRRRDWREYLVPRNYWNKLRQLFNPRFEPEGDIHVFTDDHIEWEAIAKIIRELGGEIVESSDYLLFEAGYPAEVYEQYRQRCADMHLLIARKPR